MRPWQNSKANPDPKVIQATQGFESDAKIPMGEFMQLYARFNDAIREVGKSNGVLGSTWRPGFPKINSKFYDVVHLNPLGSHRAA